MWYVVVCFFVLLFVLFVQYLIVQFVVVLENVLCVVFSGGFDFIVLFYVLVVLLGCGVLCVVYVDYGLYQDSVCWVDYVCVFCVLFNVFYVVLCVMVDLVVGCGVEVVVCEVCYVVLVVNFVLGELLFIVYYCDDQVEIVLFKLLCGVGFEGFGGMCE